MDAINRRRLFSNNENILNSNAKNVINEIKPKSVFSDRTNNVQTNTGEIFKSNISMFQPSNIKTSDSKFNICNDGTPHKSFIDPVMPSNARTNFMEIWAENEVLSDDFINKLSDAAYKMDSPEHTGSFEAISPLSMRASLDDDFDVFALPSMDSEFEPIQFNPVSLEFDDAEFQIDEPNFASFTEDEEDISFDFSSFN